MNRKNIKCRFMNWQNLNLATVTCVLPYEQCFFSKKKDAVFRHHKGVGETVRFLIKQEDKTNR
jgi:hypothetical protein